MNKTAAAIASNRTIYTHTVSAPGISHVTGKPTMILKAASDNVKLSGKTGRVFTKGLHKGNYLYQLSLEERVTCESTCPMLSRCYGNRMPFAARWEASDALMPTLAVELAMLAKRHPGGFTIRLHVLGDFYSVEYVRFWESMLEQHPMMAVYGYTHRTGEIAAEIDAVWLRYGFRFNVLQSDGDAKTNIRPVAMVDDGDLVTCPEQSGKASSCLTCGLCTNSGIRGVRFIGH